PITLLSGLRMPPSKNAFTTSFWARKRVFSSRLFLLRISISLIACLKSFEFWSISCSPSSLHDSALGLGRAIN
ncbi:hypothetical protein PMAYCL1PPCAC_15870, partial [Pristionchus mayeri]